MNLSHPQQQVKGTECGHAEQIPIVVDKRELKLENGNSEAERSYRQPSPPALIGFEACGNTQWFEDLLDRLGHEVWIGDAAKIRASNVLRMTF